MLGEDVDPFGLRDRMLLLRTIPELEALDEDALVLLAEDGRVRRFHAGARLASPERPIDRVHFLAEGRVQLHRDGQPDDRPRRVVGLLSLLSGQVSGLLATAEDDVLCVEVPAEAIFRHMVESFAVTRNAVRLLARELCERQGALPIAGAPLAPGPVPAPDGAATLVDKLILLRSTPLGRIANLEAAAELVSALTDVTYAPGDRVWARGDASSFWLRIARGEIACTAADGRRVVLGPGHLLGEIDCWGDLPRGFEARAETAVIAQRMALDEHVAVLEAHPETAAALTRVLALRVLHPGSELASAADPRGRMLPPR